MDRSQLINDINDKKNIVVKQTEKETVVVLIGKTGHGKSSLGNTLLRRDAFEVSDLVTSVTKFTINHRDQTSNLVVFDTRGPFDGSDNNIDSKEFVITLKQLTTILEGCKNGVNAFILVYNLSTKFTREEIKTIQMYKAILGQNVFKNFGVLVVTHGNNFDYDCSFKEWCEKQEGPFKDIYNDCNKRAVLVENKDTGSKKLEYRSKILDHIKSLTEPFTKENFDETENERKKACFKWEVDDLKRKYNNKLHALESKMTKEKNCTKELKLQITVLVNEITENNNADEEYNLNLELEAANKLLLKCDKCCII